MTDPKPRHKVHCEPLPARRGCLLFEPDGTPFFRVQHRHGDEVQHNDGDFTDYVIAHSDLEIEIIEDQEMAVYRRGEDLVLDHAPETLGYEREDDENR